MHNSKTLFCYNCKSVLLNLPEVEISKLNGLNFVCECCGHRNLLTKNQFLKSVDSYDPYISIKSIDSILSERAMFY